MGALLAMLLLAGCLTQILLGATKEVMWRLLAPMVGLDPNATSLFEQPIVRDRMTALLGDRYEPVLSLLKTADQLQKEGPLFYVVSRYTPIPDYAEQAGLVWDSDTNRMAVMLVTGGSPTVIAEQLLQQQVEKQVEQSVVGNELRWPAELQAVLNSSALPATAPAPESDMTPTSIPTQPSAEETLDAEIQSQEAADAARAQEHSEAQHATSP